MLGTGSGGSRWPCPPHRPLQCSHFHVPPCVLINQNLSTVVIHVSGPSPTGTGTETPARVFLHQLLGAPHPRTAPSCIQGLPLLPPRPVALLRTLPLPLQGTFSALPGGWPAPSARPTAPIHPPQQLQGHPLLGDSWPTASKLPLQKQPPKRKRLQCAGNGVGGTACTKGGGSGQGHRPSDASRPHPGLGQPSLEETPGCRTLAHSHRPVLSLLLWVCSERTSQLWGFRGILTQWRAPGEACVPRMATRAAGQTGASPREWAAVVSELKKRPRPRSPSFTMPVAVMNTLAGLMSARRRRVGV